MRQEFMQRRVEQTDCHRQTFHDPEQFGEILTLHRQQLFERRLTAFDIRGHDHLAHGDDAVSIKEHVLGAAEPDTFGTKFA